MFIMHKYTSLDDAIDIFSDDPRQLGALYLFAGRGEAKYLSQYIATRATFVDHIPSELSSESISSLLVPNYYSQALHSRSSVCCRACCQDGCAIQPGYVRVPSTRNCSGKENTWYLPVRAAE